MGTNQGREDKKTAAAEPPLQLTRKHLVAEAKKLAADDVRVPSALVANDYGSGHAEGGTDLHKCNRLQALCWLRVLSESSGHKLSPDSCRLWDDFLAWQEQTWMKEFESSPGKLGGTVHWKLCKWESEVKGKGTGTGSSFAEHVNEAVSKLIKQVK